MYISGRYISPQQSPSAAGNGSDEEKSPMGGARSQQSQNSTGQYVTQNITERPEKQLLAQDIAQATEAYRSMADEVNREKQIVSQAMREANSVIRDVESTATDKIHPLQALHSALNESLGRVNQLIDRCEYIYKSTHSANAYLEAQIEQKTTQLHAINNRFNQPGFIHPLEREASHQEKTRIYGEREELRDRRDEVFLKQGEAVDSMNPYHSLLNLLGNIQQAMSNVQQNIIYGKNKETLAKEGIVYNGLIEELNNRKAYADYMSTQPPPTPPTRFGRAMHAMLPSFAREYHQEFIGDIQADLQQSLTKVQDLRDYNLAHSNRIQQLTDQLILPDKKSAYEEVHIIRFQRRGYAEGMSIEDAAYVRSHLAQKGVDNVHQYEEDIASVAKGHRNPLLAERLSAIPRGEDAARPEVKPKKINIYIHGDRDHLLSAMSPGMGDNYRIPAEKMGDYIANHLPVGDYKQKLTIALRACYGAYKKEPEARENPPPSSAQPRTCANSLRNFCGRQAKHASQEPIVDRSTIERIADILKSHGYTGIQLTAAKALLSVMNASLEGHQTMGSHLSSHDSPGSTGKEIKFSQSDDKVVIEI